MNARVKCFSLSKIVNYTRAASELKSLTTWKIVINMCVFEDYRSHQDNTPNKNAYKISTKDIYIYIHNEYITKRVLHMHFN